MLCTQLHVNFFDLDPINIDQKLAPDLAAIRRAASHRAAPLRRGDPGRRRRRPVGHADDRAVEGHLGLQIEIITSTLNKLKAALHRLYGPPVTHDVDVFGRRNILIGPIRDHLVIELVDRDLRGVSVLSLG